MRIRGILLKNGSSTILLNISKMLSGTVIGQALSIIFLPIASRIYGAEYYGDFALFTSISSIVIGLLGFGLTSAIMVAENDNDAKGIYKVAVYGTGGILLVVFIILYLISPFFQLYSLNLNYKVSLLLLLSSIYMTNITNMTYAWLNRLGKFNILSINPILITLINNISLIILGLIGYLEIGLYFGMILSQFFTLLYLQKYKGDMKLKLTTTKIKELLKKNADFLRFQYPSGIANSIANQLPLILLSKFFGNAVVGNYYMTMKFLNIPLSLIGGSITRVYFKEASEIHRNNESARQFTYKFARVIFSLYCIPAIVIIAFGGQILPLILGMNWENAGTYLQIMIIWNMFFLLVSSIGGFPSIISMQKRNMINSFITLMANFIVLILVSILFDDPIVTLLFFVLINVLNHIWFYNDMFSKESKLKNKYLKLSIGYLTVVFIISELLTNVILCSND